MVAAILVLWSVLNAASAAVEVPQISHPVTDLAGVLQPQDEEAIARELVEHRKATGVQLAVLIVDSTRPWTIDGFAQLVFDRWGGGSKERSDGALFVLAIADRRSRLHLGYGLEALIPDAIAKRMLDDLGPVLVVGNYAQATRELVRSVRMRTDHLSPGEPIAPPFGERTWLWGMIVVVALGLGIGWAIAFRRGWRGYKRHAYGLAAKPWWTRFGAACRFLARQRPLQVAFGSLVLAQVVLAIVVADGHGYIAVYSVLYWSFVIAGWLIGGAAKMVGIPVGIMAASTLVLGVLYADELPFADPSSLKRSVGGMVVQFWLCTHFFVGCVVGAVRGWRGGSSYSSSYSSSSSSHSYSSSSSSSSSRSSYSSSSYSSSSYSGGGGRSGGGGASSSW